MDTPLPEEDDDAIFSLDPLEVVERVLTAENLVFDRTEDGEVAVTLAGDWRDYELWFAWRPEADCLQLYLATEFKAPKERRAELLELMTIVNPRVWLGHFELWGEDNEVIFRHALSLPDDERPTPAQAASMIDAAMEAADRFYPAFSFLLGGRSPEEAMAACLFETVGEA